MGKTEMTREDIGAVSRDVVKANKVFVDIHTDVKKLRKDGYGFYDVYGDPGHAWLRVKMSEIERLGIGGLISAYSYMKRTENGADWYAYLEEDADAGIFFTAKAKFGEKVALRSHSSDRHSAIRRYDSFVFKPSVPPHEPTKDTRNEDERVTAAREYLAHAPHYRVSTSAVRALMAEKGVTAETFTFAVIEETANGRRFACMDDAENGLIIMFDEKRGVDEYLAARGRTYDEDVRMAADFIFAHTEESITITRKAA